LFSLEKSSFKKELFFCSYSLSLFNKSKSKYYKVLLSIGFYIISVFVYNYYSYIDYKQKEIETINDKLKIGAYAVYNTLGEDFFKIATNKDAIS
jgi:hypothetical protein